MNKVYNTVWSGSRGMWVVTSELVRKGGPRPLQMKKAAVAGLIALILGQNVTPSWANASISVISSGQTSSSMVISSGGSGFVYSGGQASSTSVYDGGSLNVSGGSATNINQSSGAAIVMDTGAGLVSGSRYDGVSFEISSGSASNAPGEWWAADHAFRTHRN